MTDFGVNWLDEMPPDKVAELSFMIDTLKLILMDELASDNIFFAPLILKKVYIGIEYQSFEVLEFYNKLRHFRRVHVHLNYDNYNICVEELINEYKK